MEALRSFEDEETKTLSHSVTSQIVVNKQTNNNNNNNNKAVEASNLAWSKTD
jgi:hypothetical protein